MISSWSEAKALRQFNRLVDTTNTNFFSAGRAYSGSHFRALIEAAAEAVEDGPAQLALPLFEEFLHEIKKIARGGPSNGFLVDLDDMTSPFRTELEATFAAAPKKGRPFGTGKWEAHDKPVIDLMRMEMISGAAKSLTEAAMMHITKAGGTATDKSKAERLRALYQATYPD